MATEQPKIALIGLGGTIAGTGESASDSAEYKTANRSIKDIASPVMHGLREIAQIDINDLAQVGSPDITARLIRDLIREVLDRQETHDGVVISSGTDTLAELATALYHGAVKRWTKPVVLTGSMRPSTAFSADGSRNLLDAVKVASCADSKDRGVLAVMNARIYQPPYFNKMDANQLDAFTGGETGPVGRMDDDKVNFFFEPCQPKLTRVPLENLDCQGDKPFPRVHIEYAYLGHGGFSVRDGGMRDIEGIVLAGMGAGCWNTGTGQDIQECWEKADKIPIVASRRTATGFVGGGKIYGLEKSCIRAKYYTPEQAAITLQFALDNGYSMGKVEELFMGNGGR